MLKCGNLTLQRVLTLSAVDCRAVQLHRQREKIAKPRRKRPTHGRLMHDLPEFADRVSLHGQHQRLGRFRTFTQKKMLDTIASPDKFGVEWREFLDHEEKDRHPYNYPLFGAEKSTKMLRDEGYEKPDLLAYPQILIQMSSFCFTTLHAFRRILLRQFGKMDYDVEDSYASHPDDYNITYKDSDPVKMQKYKRNIIILNVNAHEMSALTRQIVDFTPESVTISITMIGDYKDFTETTQYAQNDEVARLTRLVKEMEKQK